MAHQSIIDKTSRIVFVTNISPEISEEKLKEFFRKVGSIISFKIIYDKDTGKSKGCGFCEYKDQETALNAVKSLNNLEIAGRSLKVDHALNEKSRLEMISLMQGAHNSNETNSTEKAPETISKAVASLPPEQMFELLKQMKQCVQNNSVEARNMLLQNPQLAYALLQALVVMRIVDPQIAITALNNSNSNPGTTVNPEVTFSSNLSASSMISRISTPITSSSAVDNKINTKTNTQPNILNISSAAVSRLVMNSPLPTPPPAPVVPVTMVPPPPAISQDIDLRNKSLSTSNRIEQDKLKPFAPSEGSKRDPRLLYQQSQSDSKDLKQFSGTSRINPLSNIPPSQTSSPSVTTVARTILPPASADPCVSATSGATNPSITPTTADKEKAALIMQVLRLTDAQIVMLPPEQRQSILLLKDQIAKSTNKR